MATYRLDSATILDLCRTLERELLPRNTNPHAIRPILKILAVLHFFATGSFQNTVGICGGMSQAKFSLVLTEVLLALLPHLKNYVQFPKPEDFLRVKGDFYALGGMPHVIGAIDGTHIPLVPPKDSEQVFRNRKQFHSLNVQMVCLSNHYISHVYANYPGSAHDSFVLQNSSVPDLMLQVAAEKAVLVGDAAYPNKPWLLAPLRNTRNEAEERFNVAHGKTRRIIERTFGLLKARFRCLDRTGGDLLYSPQKVSRIVVACVMLHNLAVTRKVPIPEDEVPYRGLRNVADHSDDEEADDETDLTRQEFITRFFTKK